MTRCCLAVLVLFAACKKPAEEPKPEEVPKADDAKNANKEASVPLEEVQPNLQGPLSRVPNLINTPAKSATPAMPGLRIPARPKSA